MISKGNHVKFARFVLLAVSEEAKTLFFVQFIIKQLIDSVFKISRIIKVSVRVISLSLWLWLITLTSTLIVLDITKTSSNNCLMYSFIIFVHYSDELAQLRMYFTSNTHTMNDIRNTLRENTEQLVILGKHHKKCTPAPPPKYCFLYKLYLQIINQTV